MFAACNACSKAPAMSRVLFVALVALVVVLKMPGQEEGWRALPRALWCYQLGLLKVVCLALFARYLFTIPPPDTPTSHGTPPTTPPRPTPTPTLTPATPTTPTPATPTTPTKPAPDAAPTNTTSASEEPWGLWGPYHFPSDGLVRCTGEHLPLPLLTNKKQSQVTHGPVRLPFDFDVVVDVDVDTIMEDAPPLTPPLTPSPAPWVPSLTPITASRIAWPGLIVLSETFDVSIIMEDAPPMSPEEPDNSITMEDAPPMSPEEPDDIIMEDAPALETAPSEVDEAVHQEQQVELVPQGLELERHLVETLQQPPSAVFEQVLADHRRKLELERQQQQRQEEEARQKQLARERRAQELQDQQKRQALERQERERQEREREELERKRQAEEDEREEMELQRQEQEERVRQEREKEEREEREVDERIAMLQGKKKEFEDALAGRGIWAKPEQQQQPEPEVEEQEASVELELSVGEPVKLTAEQEEDMEELNREIEEAMTKDLEEEQAWRDLEKTLEEVEEEEGPPTEIPPAYADPSKPLAPALEEAKRYDLRPRLTPKSRKALNTGKKATS
ncbi:MAG: hypothetical protein M1823_001795 [Watsoniomyces obsoletus]|nr:MAG: hypothetical protein M1823_001795 [Watsoniomyces obsoletus]